MRRRVIVSSSSTNTSKSCPGSKCNCSRTALGRTIWPFFERTVVIVGKSYARRGIWPSSIIVILRPGALMPGDDCDFWPPWIFDAPAAPASDCGLVWAAVGVGFGVGDVFGSWGAGLGAAECGDHRDGRSWLGGCRLPHRVIEVPVLHFSANDAAARQVMAGQPVETSAQVASHPSDSDELSRIGRSRLLTRCCTADARPYFIAVEPPSALSEFPAGSWVAVTGSIGYCREAGGYGSVIHATRINLVPRPATLILK